MPAEDITGIFFPAHDTVNDDSVLCAMLDAVASCCTLHLREGGYFSDLEADNILGAYQNNLSSYTPGSYPPLDFLAFTAETQAKNHALTAEGEIVRMQKILRWSLSDHVRCWTFGPLPGQVASLYGHCPALRAVCGLLGCPSVIAGETSIVHVASVNPVAALVASAWIKQELTIQSEGEAPFVFPLMVDLPSWNSMIQRHFAEP